MEHSYVRINFLFELTAIEGDFADHDPFGCEVELESQVSAHTVMELDGYISSMLHDDVGHI
jgi:hypothetical protein